MKSIRTYLAGLGNVNRSFLQIVEQKGAQLAADYGVEFRIVAVADSSGVAVDPTGFDPAATRTAKASGQRVCDLNGYQPEVTPAQLAGQLDCDLVLEASPVNLQTGEPGLGIVRAALSRGISVVLANKGPLVLAFGELTDLARRHHAGLAYSATVCGALPVINIGQRDLIAAEIRHLRGIFNATSNFVLAEMVAGRAYAAAVEEAQRRGVAEADPSLDVEGWDTANKLVIIANSFLTPNRPVTLKDVTVAGITQLTNTDLAQATAQGKRIKLIAEATLQPDGSYSLAVGPQTVAQDDFLARCEGWEMGVEIHTDLYGILYQKIWEDNPVPTAAAMLRDAVNLWRARAK